VLAALRDESDDAGDKELRECVGDKELREDSTGPRDVLAYIKNAKAKSRDPAESVPSESVSLLEDPHLESKSHVLRTGPTLLTTKEGEALTQTELTQAELGLDELTPEDEELTEEKEEFLAHVEV